VDIISSDGYPAVDSSRTTVAIDQEQHVALPKLYGAPAYARPAPIVEESPRPFDPDDLPIEAVQTPEERELASTMPAHVYAAGGHLTGQGAAYPASASTALRPKPLSLRALAGRILGGGES
jgi:hypothetical protein